MEVFLFTSDGSVVTTSMVVNSGKLLCSGGGVTLRASRLKDALVELVGDKLGWDQTGRRGRKQQLLKLPVLVCARF
jgi:hypothetical protein